jgi:hypothetical protein
LLQVATSFVVINLLTTCYVQTISDSLEQLVASLLASSTLLQDDTNLFQTCRQLGPSSANTSCLRVQYRVVRRQSVKYLCNSGLETAGCQWPKAGHILEMAGKNKFELPK